VLSVVVYGRNDQGSPGYHKRVALSLNGFAQLLAEPDDEIIFVDWNTGDEFPTLPEAIADTLTPRARARLRILRVRPRHHAEFGATQPVIECVARNVALRRSNPRNRWILATNADVIPLPAEPGETLTALTGQLPDGHYVTPRIELPAGIFRGLQRTDPAGTAQILREAGPSLALREYVFGEDDVLVDNPGDFQLFLRSRLFSIDGFDESMLGLSHVDHNIARRMRQKYGEPKSLEQSVVAYHCAHHVVPAHAHRAGGRINNPDIHVFGLKSADLPHQRARWGLPEADIEEIRLEEDGEAKARQALARILGDRKHPERRAAYRASSYGGFAYDPAHVLPHLADLFRDRDPRTRIGYAGTRPDAAALFISMAAEFGFLYRIAMTAGIAERLALAGQPQIQIVSPADFARRPDVFVFEFGATRDAGTDRPLDAEIRLDRAEVAALDDVYRLLESVVAEERAAVASLERQPRRIVTVNAIHNTYERPVAQLLDATAAPITTRLRHGFARTASQPGQLVGDGSLAEQLAAKLGRSRPVSQAEIAEINAILAEIESAGQSGASERLSAAVGVNGPGLLAFLGCEPVARAKGTETVAKLETAIRAILAKRAPTGLRIAADDARRDVARRPVSGLAASADWNDPRWLSYAHGVANDVSFDRPSARSGWIWERVHFLYALDRLADVHPVRSVLVVCELQEDLIEKLAQQFERVDLLDVRALIGTGSGKPRARRHFLGSAQPPAGKAQLHSAEDFGKLPGSSYDAILLPHAAGFVAKNDGFVGILSALEPKLALGGIIGFSSNVLLGSAEPEGTGVDMAFGTEKGLLGRIAGATGLELADGIDMALSSHDLGLIGSQEEPGLLAERGPDGATWPGVFFLRKAAETPVTAWRKLNEAILGDLTGKLRLSPGSTRIDGVVSVRPRRTPEMAFYGPYLRLPPGAYQARADLHATAARLGAKKVDGFLEVVAGDLCLAKMPTRDSSRALKLSRTYVVPFDVPASLDAEIEIRAVVSSNVAVRYSNVAITCKDQP